MADDVDTFRMVQDQYDPARHHDSFDHVSPAFGHVSRKMKKHSAVFSLVSTILGGGVLSIPFALSKTGIIGGPLLIIICAILSDFSLDLLLLSARYGSGVETFEEVAKKAYGRKAQIFTVFLLFFLTWVCCVAYLVLIGDMFAPLVNYAIPHVTISSNSISRKILVAICSVVIAPLGTLRSLNALRFTSAFCVFSVALLALCIAIRSVNRGYGFGEEKDLDEGGKHPHGHIRYWPSNFGDVLYAFPLFFVSYLCHFNVLSTHCEMKAPSRGRVKNVIHITIVLCTVLYILVGIMGYLYRVEDTCGDILQNFSDDDVLINVGRLALALTLVLSTPLLVLPCRDSFYRLWMMIRHDCSSEPVLDISSPSFTNLQILDDADVEADSSKTNGVDPQPLLSTKGLSPASDKLTSVNIDARKLEMSPKLRRAIALGVSMTSLAAAVIIPNIVVVWSFLGSTICVLIAFIFPAVMYLKITWHKKTHLYQVLAALLLVFSIFVMVGGLYEAVENLGGSDSKHCGGES